MAFVLVLAFGSVSQTSTAQAAPAGATELRFFMLAVKERPGRACKGELVHINVLVYRYKVIDGVGQGPDTVTGVDVSGNVDNPSIGQLSPTRNTTIWASGIYPGAADFVFTAENSGNTTITFTALVATPGWFGTNYRGGSRLVSAQVDVQVIPCKFKVTTIGEWRVPGPANIFITATSNEAEVKAADAQSPFTGSTSVNWVGSSSAVEDCSGAITLGSSQLNWKGVMDDNGQLSLDGTYLPAAGAIEATCSNAEATIPADTSLELTPDPVQVSAGSSTTTVRQSQVLEGPEATPGFVTIVVVPEEDRAAAFNLDSSSAWWAMLWGEFPGFNTALLALQ